MPKTDIDIDSRIDTGIGAWKEYIDFNCTIHTKAQRHHQR